MSAIRPAVLLPPQLASKEYSLVVGRYLERARAAERAVDLNALRDRIADLDAKRAAAAQQMDRILDQIGQRK